MNANSTFEISTLDRVKLRPDSVAAFRAIAGALEALPLRLPSPRELRDLEAELDSEPERPAAAAEAEAADERDCMQRVRRHSLSPVISAARSTGRGTLKRRSPLHDHRDRPKVAGRW